MTVLIGIIDKKQNKVVMGADKCISSAYRKLSMGEDSKIYQPEENKNFLFGFAGDPRIKQLFSSLVILPREEQLEAEKLEVDEKFIVRNLIPQLQKVLKENEYIDSTNTVGGMMGSRILIAYKNKLWDLCGNFQLVSATNKEGYLVAGSGEFTAVGALEAFNGLDIAELPTIYKVVKSLEYATKTAIGVEGPYDIYIAGTDKIKDDIVEKIVSGEIPMFPTEIETTKNNYSKRVKNKNAKFESMFNSYDMIFLRSKTTKTIYFLDYNDNLYGIKENGNILKDMYLVDDLYVDDYEEVELNTKGLIAIKKIEGINLTKPQPDDSADLKDALAVLESLGFDTSRLLIKDDNKKEETKIKEEIVEVEEKPTPKKETKPKTNTKKSTTTTKSTKSNTTNKKKTTTKSTNKKQSNKTNSSQVKTRNIIQKFF